MKKMKSILAAGLLFGAAALVGGCGGAGGLTPAAPVAVSTEGGVTQILMEPVDVWDAEGAAPAAAAEVDGRRLSVRKRGGGLFQQSWVRLVLGWSSARPNDVFVGAIALGPAVEVRGLRMEFDGRPVELRPTGDFSFVPGNRGIFDNQEMHLGAFIADVGWLQEAVNARDSAAVALETSRGVLAGDLNVVAGDSAGALRKSAKNRFAEFLAAVRSARN